MFLSALKKHLKLEEKEKNKYIIISGNFNLDLLMCDSDICVSRFLNLMLENNLHPCITEPTRIVHSLSVIFNKSIMEGIFPDAMKLAKILPIHKAESRYIVSNYRPISLLHILNKVFEKVTYKRLIDFITKNNILTPNEYGLQVNRTELALNAITNNIVNSSEKKESAYCIFLDFAKAFDIINHEILLKN